MLTDLSPPTNGAEEAAVVAPMGAAILWGGGAAAGAPGVCNGWIEWPPLGIPGADSYVRGRAQVRRLGNPHSSGLAALRAHISTTPKRTGGEGTDDLVSFCPAPSPPAWASLLHSRPRLRPLTGFRDNLLALGCQELPSHSLIPTLFKANFVAEK